MALGGVWQWSGLMRPTLSVFSHSKTSSLDVRLNLKDLCDNDITFSYLGTALKSLQASVRHPVSMFGWFISGVWLCYWLYFTTMDTLLLHAYGLDNESKRTEACGRALGKPDVSKGSQRPLHFSFARPRVASRGWCVFSLNKNNGIFMSNEHPHKFKLKHTTQQHIWK